MNSATHLVGLALAAVATVGVVYTLAAAVVVARFRKSGASIPGVPLPVSILKPLRGSAPGLEVCLESVFAQNYGAPVQIVFGVADPDDPAVPVVRQLMSAHSDRDAAFVIDNAIHGSNRKVSNLINIVRAAKRELLVISDSDILANPDWLSTIAGELSQPGMGAVTCLYSGKPAAGFWSELVALGISYQFLPNAALGNAIGLAHPCTGATIALRRRTLEAIGGFAAFSNELADDYEIGRAVRSKGDAVAVSSLIVEHICTETSLRTWWQHEMRWARTIRMIDSLGYAGSLVTQPIPVALLALVFLGAGISAAAILGAAVVSRLFLKLMIDQRVTEGAGRAWVLPLRDILWFGIFVLSFFGTTVRWREMQLKARTGRALRS